MSMGGEVFAIRAPVERRTHKNETWLCLGICTAPGADASLSSSPRHPSQAAMLVEMRVCHLLLLRPSAPIHHKIECTIQALVFGG